MLPQHALLTMLAPLVVAASAAPSPHVTVHAERAARPMGTTMSTHATGQFEVKLTPLSTDEPTLGRLSIDKQFHGDLDATSKGEMLAAGTSVTGSAGYVALERVTGRLAGRTGSFVLQHSGTM